MTIVDRRPKDESPESVRARLRQAVLTDRDLSFYSWIAVIPVALTVVILLCYPHLSGTALVSIAILGSIVCFYGTGQLLYELTLDIAGYPSFKLPVWAVLYLIVYVVFGFAYLYFGLFYTSPGRYIKGFSMDEGESFVDSLYLSLCGFLTMTPDKSITLPSQLSRFIRVGQGFVGLFVNAVIITKFVSAF